MKSINKVFVIATVVLGLGTTASASANNSRIEDTLKQVITKQSQQMTQRLLTQLQQTISAEVNNIARVATVTTIDNSKSQLITKANFSNTTTEEE